MTRIRSYEELLGEKARLERVLRDQKDGIRAEVQAVGKTLKPLMKFLSFVSRFGDDGAPSLFRAGAQTGVDLLVRKKISRAGWLVRAVVPAVFRTAAGSLIDGIRRKFAKPSQ